MLQKREKKKVSRDTGMNYPCRTRARQEGYDVANLDFRNTTWLFNSTSVNRCDVGSSISLETMKSDCNPTSVKIDLLSTKTTENLTNFRPS